MPCVVRAWCITCFKRVCVLVPTCIICICVPAYLYQYVFIYNMHYYVGFYFINRGNARLFELLKEVIAKQLPQWLPENLPFDEPEWSDIVSAIEAKERN